MRAEKQITVRRVQIQRRRIFYKPPYRRCVFFLGQAKCNMMGIILQSRLPMVIIFDLPLLLNDEVNVMAQKIQ